MSLFSLSLSLISNCSVPEKRVSCDSMFIPRIMTSFSWEIIEVMLFTMPISSCPTMRKVTGNCAPPFSTSLHRASMTRYG